jgi:hypothetical protein
MSPFDFIKAITETKENLFKDDPQANKDYSPFMVNKGLSFYHDTIFQANQMNGRYDAPRDWQFLYLLNSTWAKKDKETRAILLVKEYFGYSSQKAKEAARILSEEQLNTIEEKLQKGGK